MINKVYLMGELAEDPRVELTPEGRPIAYLVVTTSERRTESGQKKDKVEFHRAMVFGRQAENVAAHLRKGSEVLIDGRISMETGTYAVHTNNIKFI